MTKSVHFLSELFFTDGASKWSDAEMGIGVAVQVAIVTETLATQSALVSVREWIVSDQI